MLTMTDDLEPCLAVNGNGAEYHEFSCIYPALKPYYFGFERFYDPAPVYFWMLANPYFPVLICALYGLLIVAGQSYFETRKAWNWRKTMAAWNLFLSVFSFCGVIRTVPQLWHDVTTMSLRDNLCKNPESIYGSGSTGLWMQLFVFSKFPELLDTFFIVIHKKNLIFLHWYHHITVLLYCWFSYAIMSSTSIFFVVMNYAVHAVMYFYYFLMAAKLKPKWFKAVLITGAQIAQMFVGVIVTCLGFYYSQVDDSCHIKSDNNTAAFLMYGSYLFLFLQFFMGRYNPVGNVKKGGEKKSGESSKAKQS